jgi:hypothetical protein
MAKAKEIKPPYEVALVKPDRAPDYYTIQRNREDGGITTWGHFEYEFEAENICSEIVRAFKIGQVNPMRPKARKKVRK